MTIVSLSIDFTSALAEVWSQTGQLLDRPLGRPCGALTSDHAIAPAADHATHCGPYTMGELYTEWPWGTSIPGDRHNWTVNVNVKFWPGCLTFGGIYMCDIWPPVVLWLGWLPIWYRVSINRSDGRWCLSRVGVIYTVSQWLPWWSREDHAIGVGAI